jgi:hypothetical protein
MQSNVNLQVDTGATLQNNTPTATFITNTGTVHDIEISGGGVINGNASTTSSNNMMPFNNVTNLEVTDVSILNSPHEHLVPEACTNVTINGVNINDPLGYQAATFSSRTAPWPTVTTTFAPSPSTPRAATSSSRTARSASATASRSAAKPRPASTECLSKTSR